MPILSPLAKPAALQEALVLQGKAVVRRVWRHGGSYACQQPLLSWWHHACERTVAMEGTQAGVTNRLADVHSLCIVPQGWRPGSRALNVLRVEDKPFLKGWLPPAVSSTATQGPSRLACLEVSGQKPQHWGRHRPRPLGGICFSREHPSSPSGGW